jgi:hypothetical protein
MVGEDGSSLNSLLSVRAEGPATEGGRLPLAELARIVGGLQMTLERLALALTGSSVTRGRRPREVVEAVRLDFAGFRPGSAILDLTPSSQGLDDLLVASLDALQEGVSSVSRGIKVLPQYFTSQVINGLRELAGGINPGNMTAISFARHGGLDFVIDSNFREGLRLIQLQALEEEATVVGRLHMGDFSPAALRCRIDTFAGSVLADFDTDQRDTVLDAMDQLVMARGTAELQPDGSTVRVLHLAELEILPSARMSPLETLQRQQGVAPVMDFDELVGPPIDDFDVFMEAITSARQGDL